MAACDDSPGETERVHEALRAALRRLGIPVRVAFRAFTGGEELCSACGRQDFDLVFLDIAMPGTDGFRAAERLRMEAPGTRIVFVSEHERLVFDSFEYAPLWFVRKGRLEHDMFRAVNKYFQSTARRRVTYRIKEGLGYRDVRISDILYVECEGHSLTFRLVRGPSVRAYGSLKPVEEELARYDFLRVHRNYLVNQRYIELVERHEILLSGGIRVDMGRDRRKSVNEAVAGYLRKMDREMLW